MRVALAFLLFLLTTPAWALQPILVDQYGARPDGVVRTDCAITSGAAILTCTASRFAPSDVGKKIAVYGAGPLTGGYRQPLSTTIATRQSLTQVTLSANASATVSPSPRVVYGTDNTATLQRLLDTYLAASDGQAGNVGGVLQFGPGLYLVKALSLPCSRLGTFTDGACPRSYNNITIQGAGPQATALENWDISTTAAVLDLGSKTNFPAVYNDGNALLSGFRLTDLTLRQVGFGTNLTAKVIASFVVVDSLVQRVTVTGSSYECLHMSGWRLTIRDNYASGCGGAGPAFGSPLSAFNVTCVDCLFVNNTFDMALGGGGYASEASFSRSLVQGNHFTCDPVLGGTGFEFGSEGHGIFDMTVVGNVIRYCGIHLSNANATANRVYFKHNTIINGAIAVGGGVQATGSGQTFWPGELDTIVHGPSVIDGNTFIIDGMMTFANLGISGIYIGEPTAKYAGQESWLVTNNTLITHQAFCSDARGTKCQSNADCVGLFCVLPTGLVYVRAAGGGVPWAPSTACTAEGNTPGTQTSTSYVYPIVYNGSYYRCTTAGTTGATEPTWPVSLGATVADGTAVWTNAGVKPSIVVADNHVQGPDPLLLNSHGTGNGELFLDPASDRDSVQISNFSVNYKWTLQAQGANSPASETIPASAAYGDLARFFSALPTLGYYAINTQITNTAPSGGARGWVATRAGRAGAAWQTGHAYAFGDWVVPTADNGHAYTQRTGAGCTSHASTQPTWPTGAGATVADNTCSWKESGAAVLWLQF